MAINEALLVNAAVQVGLADAAQVGELRQTARRNRRSLLDELMRHYRFPQSAVFQALATLHGLPYVAAHQVVPAREVMGKVSLATLQRRKVLPVKLGEELVLATLDPADQVALETVNRALGRTLKPAVADPEALGFVLAALDGGTTAAPDDAFDSVSALDEVMKQAYIRRASDIHVEPGRDYTRIRMRVDGHMQTLGLRLARNQAEALVNRIKVLSGMDISEQRKPQDGGFSYAVQAWDLPETDLRAATVPSRWGERVTLRILGQADSVLSLAQLGMPERIQERLLETLGHPFGMLLVTGPTGSGKSTTLYACLRELDADDLNILTAEDPVEQSMPGITQVQIGGKVDFATTLRSFLRHDPDVVLVGEIRDLETAETALKASMTGHLVLSTLHTNDAVSAVSRLVNLGCDRYLVGNTLVGVLAQRLVRRLCTHCKEAYTADPAASALLGCCDGTILYRAKGCPVCLGSGYSGRTGLYEALWIDADLGGRIAAGLAETALRREVSYSSLWQCAAEKVLAGETALDEVRGFAQNG
jgi:type II secretory ATPase GspE/PulE/Tfp pilus assembly ATPase PilB-like protein